MKLSDYEDSNGFIKKLPGKPGVYRMLGEKEQVLYVGKARNLPNRVSSYFNASSSLSNKTRALMNQTLDVEVTVTRSEAEALILENNLIKEHKPRYNVLLRDDKSYPYIYLGTDQDFPRLQFHRGAQKAKGKYFGPFPSAGAVRQTLNLLQKLFKIRSCEDSVFKNRARPCLQYQINRCTAPCVDMISRQEYQTDLQHAVMFLEGKNEALINDLYEPMQVASDALDFERAAHYRDQIANLRKVQEHQLMSNVRGDVDVIACQQSDGNACIQVFYLRSGLHLGGKSFFPAHTRDASVEDIIAAFISQYYLKQATSKRIPKEIVVSHMPPEHEPIEEVLADIAGHKVNIKAHKRGEKLKWLNMASENANMALKSRLAREDHQQLRLKDLKEALKFDDNLEHIECFDISHTQGGETVASCVVFADNGMKNSLYRRFNIRDITPGDDYAAMEQALTRRYTRVQKEEGLLPDLILIDGGKGQLAKAVAVMKELQLDYIRVVGVAKGPARRAGQEKLIIADAHATIQLAADSPGLHLIQQIRDEAHRFAISGHRQRRQKR